MTIVQVELVDSVGGIIHEMLLQQRPADGGYADFKVGQETKTLDGGFGKLYVVFVYVLWMIFIRTQIEAFELEHVFPDWESQL